MILQCNNNRTTTFLYVVFTVVSSVCCFSPIHHNHHQHHQNTNLFAAGSDGTVVLDGQEISGPITPLGNFLLVRTKDTLMATGGGILLPDNSIERPTEGDVIAAGPGKLHPHTGVRIRNPIKEGMAVVYGKFDGFPVTYNDEDMQIIRDDDVMLYYSTAKTKTMSKENVIPFRDYVLVKVDKAKMETSSGIVVAESVMKDDAPCIGTVAKVGEGRMCSTGELTPSPVNVGDRIKFKDFAGNEVLIENEDYCLVRMVEILCVADGKDE